MFKLIRRGRRMGSAWRCSGGGMVGRPMVCALLVGLGTQGWGQGDASTRTFYVSPAGRDAWSGRLAAPNPERTDGPFASIPRARDAIRRLKERQPAPGPITVQVRGGQYFLDAPIRFGPEDSGTDQGVISYVAYPGEVPELIGGRRLAVGTLPAPGRPLTF
ncbi:MAG TPA: hypothetical protein VK150_05700, partial [Geothrix sp.]|nr:hypothetical protein [Geothrix sp.]